jgi:hypothetical protein
MKRILLILLIISFKNGICQTADILDPIFDYYDIDKEPDEKPIRINLIFLRDNNGNGNFLETDQFISDLISDLTNIYSNIPSDYDPSCYDGSNGVVHDSKIRFNIENIMFINNTYYWNNENSPGWGCPDTSYNSSYHLARLNDSIASISPYPIINVFYTENATTYENIVVNHNCPWESNNGIESVSCSEFPSGFNHNINQSVHMRNHYVKYYWLMNCVVDNKMGDPKFSNPVPTLQDVQYWARSGGKGLAHELGHSLSLEHPSGDLNECDHGCKKHLMMNKECNTGVYISPHEIRKIHYAASTSSLRRYVPEYVHSDYPIIINQTNTWTTDIRIYRGLTITNGATFTLGNELIIPSECNIIVSHDSQLDLLGALIHTPHTNSALDLVVMGTVNITNSTIKNSRIVVNSGSILNLITSNDATKHNEIFLGSNGSFSVEQGAEFTVDIGAPSAIYVSASN